MDSDKKMKKGDDSKAVKERRSLHRQVTTCQFKRQHSTQSFTQASGVVLGNIIYGNIDMAFVFWRTQSLYHLVKHNITVLSACMRVCVYKD